jgi:hypothetical protein
VDIQILTVAGHGVNYPAMQYSSAYLYLPTERGPALVHSQILTVAGHGVNYLATQYSSAYLYLPTDLPIERDNAC